MGSLGVPGLASMVGGQTSWLARMFGLCQDDIILAEANILAYPKVWYRDHRKIVGNTGKY